MSRERASEVQAAVLCQTSPKKGVSKPDVPRDGKGKGTIALISTHGRPNLGKEGWRRDCVTLYGKNQPSGKVQSAGVPVEGGENYRRIAEVQMVVTEEGPADCSIEAVGFLGGKGT